MKPGAYIFCRKIAAGIIGEVIRPRHQFVVLVPEKKDTLKGLTQDIGGINCLLIGAYNVDNKLRADKWAESDTSFLKSKIKDGKNSDVESDIVRIQVCIANGEDVFLDSVYLSYSKYKTFEGKSDEISYPSDPFDQLDSKNFNSNSWAQSLIFWSSCKFNGAIVQKDFSGFDVGNNRLIPKKFFLS